MQLNKWSIICACILQCMVLAKAATSSDRAEQPAQAIVANGTVLESTVTSFSGGQYEYDGNRDRETFVDLIATSGHQVTMLLKEGRGSPGHMEGLGVQYHKHRIIISVVGNALTVLLNGRALSMRQGESKQDHVLDVYGHKPLALMWSSGQSAQGDTVEITTELLRLLVWVNPAQAQDRQSEVGAALCLDVALLESPKLHSSGLEDDALPMGGVIGEGFWELVDAGGAPEDIDGVPSPRHEMASYFERRRPLASASGGSSLRLLRSREGAREDAAALAFPLRARAGGAASQSHMRRLARRARMAREVQDLQIRDVLKPRYSRPARRSLGAS